MPKINSHPDEKMFGIDINETILDASLYAGIPHIRACGGRARCSTCRILVTEGIENCDTRTASESALAQKLGFSSNIRLACQTKVRANITMQRLVLDIEDAKLASDRIEFDKIGEEKPLAILFSDIRGFTKLSEAMLPYDVIYILNRYFQAMGEVIDRYDGVINNFMDEGFIALFGLNQPDLAAENAVRAALDMLTEVENLNNRIELLFDRPLQVGIGIHYGTVVLGEVGTRSQKNITAIGDAVNFASRIESANKEFGTTILVSADVYRLVDRQITISGSPKEVEIRGKTGTYRLYEVVGINAQASIPESVTVTGDRPRQNVITNLKKLWQLLCTRIF
jgi:adenylate cyclase